MSCVLLFSYIQYFIRLIARTERGAAHRKYRANRVSFRVHFINRTRVRTLGFLFERIALFFNYSLLGSTIARFHE